MLEHIVDAFLYGTVQVKLDSIVEFRHFIEYIEAAFYYSGSIGSVNKVFDSARQPAFL